LVRELEEKAEQVGNPITSRRSRGTISLTLFSHTLWLRWCLF
jgi:hypothetical protein